MDEEALERQVLIEQKVQHLEVEVLLSLEQDQNRHSGVSDGPSQNRLKARANLEETRIVMMKRMFIGQHSVRSLSSKYSL